MQLSRGPNTEKIASWLFAGMRTLATHPSTVLQIQWVITRIRNLTVRSERARLVGF